MRVLNLRRRAHGKERSRLKKMMCGKGMDRITISKREEWYLEV